MKVYWKYSMGNVRMMAVLKELPATDTKPASFYGIGMEVHVGKTSETQAAFEFARGDLLALLHYPAKTLSSIYGLSRGEYKHEAFNYYSEYECEFFNTETFADELKAEDDRLANLVGENNGTARS